MEEENEKPSPEEIKKLVKEIRKWIEIELPDARKDDHIILRFLEGCKYRIDMAKTKLKSHYHFRRDTPEWFENRDPEGEDIKDALAAGVSLYPINSRNETGLRIVFTRPCFHDASLSGDSYFKLVAMINEEAMEGDPSIARDGIVVIIDLEKTTLKHCLKKVIVFGKMRQWSAGSPMRMEEIHMINFPSFASFAFNMVKSFLKEKVRKRIMIHRNVSDLKDYIDPKYLPEEYGGTAGSTEDMVKECHERIVKKRDWFLDSKNFL